MAIGQYIFYGMFILGIGFIILIKLQLLNYLNPKWCLAKKMSKTVYSKVVDDLSQKNFKKYFGDELMVYAYNGNFYTTVGVVLGTRAIAKWDIHKEDGKILNLETTDFFTEEAVMDYFFKEPIRLSQGKI